MSNRDRLHDDWDDEDEGDGKDWQGDQNESDDEPTVPCPYCRRQIHEDSQQCPYCEKYLSDEDVPPSAKPLWIVLGVIACLLVMYCWVFGVPRW